MPSTTTGTVSATTGAGTFVSSGTFGVTANSLTTTQQGAKVIGTGAVGNARQGRAVAISADGNTAIIGGYADNGNAGAAWIFTRTGGVWSQQGAKLVGTGAVGGGEFQGQSVAISADGNTVAVGGYGDNGFAGATWVYTRTAGVWTQQGAKLVGVATAVAMQGNSVALSADGNTLAIGAPNDNGGIGAALVYTRTAGVWTQQGAKLVGTGNTGNSRQGESVSLSADSNTLLVGGVDDNGSIGAAWVYTRTAGVWAQQGA